MNTQQMELIEAIWRARDTGEDAEIKIGDNIFAIKMTQVDRVCYDFELTPTATLKLNGKRISRKAAIAMLA